ncbi:Acyl-CoA dehydrogenase NM domain-like protein [Mycena kentingensis (nom. inval.)]|nr:Acyl-CoA dehydrogenase NM domain-like protein [Mycena kentingensis (nom. inval.)]
MSQPTGNSEQPPVDLELFKDPAAHRACSTAQRIHLSIQKCQKIAGIYALSLADIELLSTKFWDFHRHPVVCADGGATTLLSIQFNLVIGTILDCVGHRPDLDHLFEDLLAYRISGQFCLTEVDHGLDAANLETTAEEHEDGSGFVLNTPHDGAAKFMPPTVPCGIPCVAVVMARLVRGGADLGVRPFLVELNDGEHMSPGVVAKLLPNRGGSSPVAHCLTSFTNVRLPPTSLLSPGGPGSSEPIPFRTTIRRVAIGSLALSGAAIPSLAHAATIAAKYSQRRLTRTGGVEFPIIAFPTQHAPILIALAQSFVLAEFYKRAAEVFSEQTTDPRVQHGIATSFKAVAARHALDGMLELSERCGAQGLFNYNKISEFHADLRGNAIAEGDILGLSIRLISELLQDKYTLDAFLSPSEHNTPLARHAESLLILARTTLQKRCNGSHRSPEFARLVLPRCRPITEALGMHYAYAAAVGAGMDARITRLYLTTAMRADEGWYVEHFGAAADALFEAQAKAVTDALPVLGQWIGRGGAEGYVSAPIVKEEEWRMFAGSLDVFREGPSNGEQIVRSRL